MGRSPAQNVGPIDTKWRVICPLHPTGYIGTDRLVNETTSVPNFRQPMANIPKLHPQQVLMPQENPFDIQSDLIPYQEK